MPNRVTRVYASGQQARDAIASLAGEFSDSSIHAVMPPQEGEPAGDIAAAVHALGLDESTSQAIVEMIHQGRALVSVSAPYGFALHAANLLDAAGPMDTGLALAPPREENARWTPFSELIGARTLSRRKYVMSGVWGDELLRTPGYSFSKAFGFPLLSKPPGESSFGMSLLRKPPGDSSFGMKLLTNPPGDSSFGLPLLTRPPRDSSFGLPLLVRSQTPLSSAVGVPPLSNRRD